MTADHQPTAEYKWTYAWNWFQYHADQRLRAFHFFLILTSAVIVGYASAVNDESRIFGVAVALIGTSVAVAFYVLDVRNQELVEYGRIALSELENIEGFLDTVRLTNYDRKRPILSTVLQNDPFVIGWLARRWISDDDAESHKKFRARTESLVTHSFWLRFIIGLAGASFFGGMIWAILDFPG